jgi:hypothetical protein
MPDIMVRVEAEDYDAWLKTHYDHVEDRRSYDMRDGPVYRDIDNPNAALFHLQVQDLERAMQFFVLNIFKEERRSEPWSLVGTSTWPDGGNPVLSRGQRFAARVSCWRRSSKQPAWKNGQAQRVHPAGLSPCRCAAGWRIVTVAARSNPLYLARIRHAGSTPALGRPGGRPWRTSASCMPRRAAS